jgi:signal transduction histidine kinase
VAGTTARVRLGRRGIRARILAIAWIPSLLLLVGGLGASGVLVFQGTQTAKSTDRFNADTPGVTSLAVGLAVERRASIIYLTDRRHDQTTLPDLRRDVDNTSRQVLETARQRAVTDSTYAYFGADVTRSLADLPAMRKKIDSGQVGLLEIEDFYFGAIDVLANAVYRVVDNEPVPRAAVALVGVVALFKATAFYFQADELALVGAIRPGLSQAEYIRYTQALANQRMLLDQARLSLDPTGVSHVDELRKSPPWLRLEAAHDAILRGGPVDGAASWTATGTDGTGAAFPAALLPDPTTWNADIGTVLKGFVSLGVSAAGRAAALAHDAGQSRIERAVIAGVLLFLLGIVVLVVTTRTSGRLVDRLRRLREETLLLSRERVPDVVARLREGESVDVAAEVTPLDLGDDEIGQVAQAFNQAQETAIAAAVGEAEVRAGLRTVFTNIAHRSQGIVHRQLDLLDRAERSQEDPDQLALLFELDHLTTRARRNAENLIILGGGQAGRQWRNPVPLLQVMRGAISEARDYVRVSLGKLPQVSIMGGGVADVVHLIAELVDNATSFSPPQSPVEVRGNVVGRGIVLEVEDQGLGIEPERLEQLNEMLSQPPDFQAMALADEPRLGIFVVAQLAVQHGIRVTLLPSPAYGGTKAVVLIPSSLVATGDLLSLPTAEARSADPVSPASAPVALTASSGTVASGSVPPRAPLHRRRRSARSDATTAPPVSPHPEPLPLGRPNGPDPGKVSADPGANHSELAGDGERPPLPRRSRQAHIVQQLRTPATTEASPDDRPSAEAGPEGARRWLAAFQNGTRRAREEDARSSEG